MIEFQNVKKVYQTKKQTVEALKRINLTVEKGGYIRCSRL
ncbi:ABC-type lipoprotein export system ATPase subunit [Peribacillus simplex]|nr:ABC-type lipoprotein export system ATPase subunit [Peribacillus simplex]